MTDAWCYFDAHVPAEMLRGNPLLGVRLEFAQRFWKNLSTSFSINRCVLRHNRAECLRALCHLLVDRENLETTRKNRVFWRPGHAISFSKWLRVCNEQFRIRNTGRAESRSKSRSYIAELIYTWTNARIRNPNFDSIPKPRGNYSTSKVIQYLRRSPPAAELTWWQFREQTFSF